MLQQRFFEFRMKPDSDVADHISNVAFMANQLCDLGEPVSEHVFMTKILCILPPSFRHLASTWDNIPTNQQNIESLTFQLIKEESQNCLQDVADEEGDKAYLSSCGQGFGGS